MADTSELPTREAYWTLLVGVMGLNTTTSNSHVNMWRAADALVHLHRNSRISQAEAQAPAPVLTEVERDRIDTARYYADKHQDEWWSETIFNLANIIDRLTQPTPAS